MSEENKVKGSDEMFCQSCGALIKKQAVICVKCGVPVKGNTSKSKTTAVLLAVFLGGWTWLYTYQKDSWKFWLGIVLSLIVFNPLWSWLLLFIPNVAIWIWAIIDVSIKSNEFYLNYPN